MTKAEAIEYILSERPLIWCSDCARTGASHELHESLEHRHLCYKKCELCDGRGYSWNWTMVKAYKIVGIPTYQYTKDMADYASKYRWST